MKSGIKTTELWLTVAIFGVIVALSLAAANDILVVPDSVLETIRDAGAILGVGYAVSRGVAKRGR